MTEHTFSLANPALNGIDPTDGALDIESGVLPKDTVVNDIPDDEFPRALDDGVLTRAKILLADVDVKQAYPETYSWESDARQLRKALEILEEDRATTDAFDSVFRRLRETNQVYLTHGQRMHLMYQNMLNSVATSPLVPYTGERLSLKALFSDHRHLDVPKGPIAKLNRKPGKKKTY